MAERKLSEKEKSTRRLAKARMSTPKKKGLLGRFAAGLKALATGTSKQRKATEFAASQARKRNKAKQNLMEGKARNPGLTRMGKKVAAIETESDVQYEMSQLRKKKKADKRKPAGKSYKAVPKSAGFRKEMKKK